MSEKAAPDNTHAAPSAHPESIIRVVNAIDGTGLTGVMAGVGNGLDALMLLASARVARLYCVDTWGGEYPQDGVTPELREAAAAQCATVLGSFDNVINVKRAFEEDVNLPDGERILPKEVDFVYLSPRASNAESVSDILAAVSLNPRVLTGRGYVRDKSEVAVAVDGVFGAPDRVFPDSSWAVYNPASRIGHPVVAGSADSVPLQASGGIAGSERPAKKTRGLPLGKCADGALVVCFTGTPDRAAAHKADCDRVGLPVEQIWQFPTPFDKYFSDSVPHTGQFDERPGWANSWFGHYRAIKLAYERGYNSALIMEDDCRFMLDVDRLNEIVADVPDDFDFALLDHFYCRWDVDGRKNYETLRGTRVTKYWSEFAYDMYSAACYLISRKAMERLIWLHESLIDPELKTRMMRVTDYWHNRGNLGPLNLYFCTPNCAIQRNQDASTVRLSDTTGINSYYTNMGIDFKAYSLG